MSLTFLLLTRRLTYGVLNAGTSGVVGRLLGQPGDSGAAFPCADGVQWPFGFLILNPGVQNTGGSGEFKLSPKGNENNVVGSTVCVSSSSFKSQFFRFKKIYIYIIIEKFRRIPTPIYDSKINK